MFWKFLNKRFLCIAKINDLLYMFQLGDQILQFREECGINHHIFGFSFIESINKCIISKSSINCNNFRKTNETRIYSNIAHWWTGYLQVATIKNIQINQTLFPLFSKEMLDKKTCSSLVSNTYFIIPG